MSYSIRFTPRKRLSTWSAINIRRVGELIEQRLMHPAGMKAFEARREDRSRIYSFEQECQFKAHRTAWKFFPSQPLSYRRPAAWWVVSAKREETRKKRLATLIDFAARGDAAPGHAPGGC